MKTTAALLIFLFLSGFSPVLGQKGPVEGQLIVQLHPGITPNQWLKSGIQARFGNIKWNHQRALGRLHNYHLFSVDPALTGNSDWLREVALDPMVKAAQWDYRLEFRTTTPNDHFYPEQWDMDRIGLPQVWDITTGGLTALGDTIVVAYLDTGFNLEHTELRDNIWYNHAEIPGDGLDNDQNGYIDDWQGWNFIDDSPVHRAHFHGHQGASIVGARGNNTYGIAGVNWQLKLMLFETELISQAVEAYEYVIDQRSRYNASDGGQGAFVVATNASFGFGRRFCSEAPIWGQMYDPLGEVGVLTAAAADNKSYDVDVVGDLPATCPSEYLIAVMNTTIEDKASQQTAFGKINIDLAAPGDGSGATGLHAEFDTFDGNSAAAPHVTGAIALLYSLPCEGLAEDALKNPAATALKIRQAILDGVDKLPSLNNLNATGGRLNVFGALERLQAGCDATTGPLQIIRVHPNPVQNSLTVEFETPDYETYELEIFDALGRKISGQPVDPPRFGVKSIGLELGPLQAGMYFLRIKRGKDAVAVAVVKI